MRELLKERGGCRGERAGIDPAARRLVPEDRRCERTSLRRRQYVECRILDGCEEVAEPGERERSLDACRSRGEHAPAAWLGGEVDAGFPDGGLPDSRRAADGERGGSVGHPPQERLDRAELAPPADDL